MLGLYALGELSVGDMADAPSAPIITIIPRLGALGEFALGQQGLSTSGTAYLQDIIAAVVSTVSISALKNILRDVAASCAASVSMTKRAGKAVPASCASAATFLKQVAHSVTVVSPITVVVTTVSVIFQVISIACATSTSITKSALKIVSASLSTFTRFLLSHWIERAEAAETWADRAESGETWTDKSKDNEGWG